MNIFLTSLLPTIFTFLCCMGVGNCFCKHSRTEGIGYNTVKIGIFILMLIGLFSNVSQPLSIFTIVFCIIAGILGIYAGYCICNDEDDENNEGDENNS